MNNEKGIETSCKWLIAIVTVIAVEILVAVSIFLILKTDAELNPAKGGSFGSGDCASITLYGVKRTEFQALMPYRMYKRSYCTQYTHKEFKKSTKKS